MRTPLAAIVTASLLTPSIAPAQAVGSAVPAARPGASAFPFPAPTLEERRGGLIERLEGWKTMIPERSALAKDFIPEMAALKAQLASAKTPGELTLWAFVVDAFETRLMDRLNPKLPFLPEEERQAARRTLMETKEALAALNRRRVGADGRTAREIDGLKRQIKAMGLSETGLSTLFDRTRGLTGDALETTSALSAASFPFSDWTYPRPAVPQRPYGTLAVPEPGRSGPPVTMDEAQVIAVARRNGLDPTIVRQAYRESRRQGVDFRMVLAVIEAESAYNPRATSPVGARGLMQIMPGTGRGLGVSNSNALYDVATNIRAGVKYLAGLWRQFSDVAWANLESVNPWSRSDVKSAIAAYNAGPGAVRKYGGVPPYRETRGYVAKVLQNYAKYERMF